MPLRGHFGQRRTANAHIACRKQKDRGWGLTAQHVSVLAIRLRWCCRVSAVVAVVVAVVVIEIAGMAVGIMVGI